MQIAWRLRLHVPFTIIFTMANSLSNGRLTQWDTSHAIRILTYEIKFFKYALFNIFPSKFIFIAGSKYDDIFLGFLSSVMKLLNSCVIGQA